MSAQQVDTFFKDNLGRCGCGCDCEGVLRAKAWRDGVRCVKQGCQCRRCVGARNRRMGARGQSAVAKAIGVPTSTLKPGHEEFAGGEVRYEAKQGKQAESIGARFAAAEAQSNVQRPIGDHRPFVAGFKPKGWSDTIIAFRGSAAREVVAALAVQLGVMER